MYFNTRNQLWIYDCTICDNSMPISLFSESCSWRCQKSKRVELATAQFGYRRCYHASSEQSWGPAAYQRTSFVLTGHTHTQPPIPVKNTIVRFQVEPLRSIKYRLSICSKYAAILRSSVKSSIFCDITLGTETDYYTSVLTSYSRRQFRLVPS
jgi:hypothetical protein